MKIFPRFASCQAMLCACFASSFALTSVAQTGADPQLNLSADSRFLTPSPLYPMLVDGDTRQWTAQVAFDERGHATEAVLIRSSGGGQLDSLITRWIKTHWQSRAGKPATLITSGK